MIRSIGTVVAGVVAWTALWLPFNAAVRALMPGSFADDGTTRSPGVLVIVLTGSVVFSVVAGWLTGALARTSPVGHATALGGVQLAIGVFVQVQYWDRLPAWYHVAFLALLLPATVLGGWLRRCRVVEVA